MANPPRTRTPAALRTPAIDDAFSPSDDEIDQVDLVGQQLGNWRLVRPLGTGAFGTVYEAENEAIAGRMAAIKVLHPQLAMHRTLKQRFLNEASAASLSDHENIVQVFDGGITAEGLCYSVMELLRGEPLGVLVARGPLSVERTINVGRQVASALSSAHQAGIVHRDLKPDNIFIVPRASNPEFVKVLDFGIAKLHTGATDGALTGHGVALGTPQYMAPEQWQTLPDIDGRADIYSLGIILYRCLTGVLPFRASTPYEWFRAHLEQPVPDLVGLRERWPLLVQVLERMLAKDRNHRHASMMQVISDLEWVRLDGGRRIAPANATTVKVPNHRLAELLEPSQPDIVIVEDGAESPTTGRDDGPPVISHSIEAALQRLADEAEGALVPLDEASSCAPPARNAAAPDIPASPPRTPEVRAPDPSAPPMPAASSLVEPASAAAPGSADRPISAPRAALPELAGRRPPSASPSASPTQGSSGSRRVLAASGLLALLTCVGLPLWPTSETGAESASPATSPPPAGSTTTAPDDVQVTPLLRVVPIQPPSSSAASPATVPSSPRDPAASAAVTPSPSRGGRAGAGAAASRRTAIVASEGRPAKAPATEGWTNDAAADPADPGVRLGLKPVSFSRRQEEDRGTPTPSDLRDPFPPPARRGAPPPTADAVPPPSQVSPAPSHVTPPRSHLAPPPAPVIPPAPPAPNADKEELEAARLAFRTGEYRATVQHALRINEGPLSTEKWRLLGTAACALADRQRAAEALRHLDRSGAGEIVRTTCSAGGVSL